MVIKLEILLDFENKLYKDQLEVLNYQFELFGTTLLLVYQHICSFINTVNHNRFYTSNDLCDSVN
jgi:hypothetical protein